LNAAQFMLAWQPAEFAASIKNSTLLVITASLVDCHLHFIALICTTWIVSGSMLSIFCHPPLPLSPMVLIALKLFDFFNSFLLVTSHFMHDYKDHFFHSTLLCFTVINQFRVSYFMLITWVFF